MSKVSKSDAKLAGDIEGALDFTNAVNSGLASGGFPEYSADGAKVTLYASDLLELTKGGTTEEVLARGSFISEYSGDESGLLVQNDQGNPQYVLDYDLYQQALDKKPEVGTQTR